MRVQFIVSPKDGRWSLSRGSHHLNDFDTKADAIRAADNLARAVARNEHTAVKVSQNGQTEEIAAYKREGFIPLN
jgi:hypothetical protein